MRGVVLFVGLFAVGFAGCGGGSTESATQPRKADFSALADVICKNHQSRTEDLESQTIDLGPLDSNSKARRVAALLRQQEDNLATEAQELQALEPPSPDVSRVGSVLALLRAKAAVIGKWAKAYDDLNTAQIGALRIRIGVATVKARNAARAYGFTVCGQD